MGGFIGRTVRSGMLSLLFCSSCGGVDDTDADAGRDADAGADIGVDGGVDSDHVGVADADETTSEDTGLDGDSEAEPDSSGPRSFELYLYEYSQWVSGYVAGPIEDGQVAVDTTDGRLELFTDAEGRAQFTVDRPDEPFTVTAAAEGFVPAYSMYRINGEDIDREIAAEGDFSRPMSRIPPLEPPEMVTLNITTSGLSSATTVFVSAVPRGWIYVRSQFGTSIDVLRGDAPLRVVGLVLEEGDISMELVEEVIPDTFSDRDVDLAFDGVNEFELSTSDFTLRIPDDPDSFFHGASYGSRSEYGTGFEPIEDGRIRGGFQETEPSTEPNTMLFEARFFPSTEELTWFMYLPVERDDRNLLTMLYFSATPEPGAVYGVLDLPYIVEPSDTDLANLNSTFECHRVTGAYSHVLQIEDFDLTYWSIESPRDVVFELPQLPSGFDPSTTWPGLGFEVRFRFYASGPLAAAEMPESPWRLGNEGHSQSDTGHVTLEW